MLVLFERQLAGNHLTLFKVAKSITCFDWYYMEYGNHYSLQAMLWIRYSLQTQAFNVPETRAANLSVFTSHVIEYKTRVQSH